MSSLFIWRLDLWVGNRVNYKWFEKKINFWAEGCKKLSPTQKFFYVVYKEEQLFLLVTILAQTLFALVSSHLVAFAFFSAGHDDNLYGLMINNDITM